MKKLLIASLMLTSVSIGASSMAGAQWTSQDKKTQQIWDNMHTLLKKNATVARENWTQTERDKLADLIQEARRENMKLSNFFNSYLPDYNSLTPRTEALTFVTEINKIAPILFGSPRITDKDLLEAQSVSNTLKKLNRYGTYHAIHELLAIPTTSPAPETVGGGKKLPITAPGKPALRPAGSRGPKEPAPQEETDYERTVRELKEKKEKEEERRIAYPPVCSGPPSLWESTKPSWSQINALLRKNTATPYEQWSKDDKDLLQDIESKIGQSHPLSSFLKYYYALYDQLRYSGQREQLMADMNSIAPDMFNDQRLTDAAKKKIETMLKKHFDAQQLREIMSIIQKNR